jgi:protein-L-isoaspartate(D-aspartate) O-methyltransferase
MAAVHDSESAVLARAKRTMLDKQLRARGITDARVLAAFAHVPREAFIAPELRAHSYDDTPLPIGENQTISQPYVVALTTAALALTGGEHVLEVGTGCGYAAAILGTIAAEVTTVERIAALAETASARLRSLYYTNIYVHHADGTLGWPPRAPYDAIAVAAGAPTAPRSLLAQLKIGGRLVIPTGPLADQHLRVFIRASETEYEERDLGEVRFVPLVGMQGWAASETADLRRR